MVDLTGDVSFQTTDDLHVRKPLGPAPLDVSSRPLITSQAVYSDDMECAVGIAVASMVESIPLSLSRLSRNRGHAAEHSERRLGSEAAWIISRGHVKIFEQI